MEPIGRGERADPADPSHGSMTTLLRPDRGAQVDRPFFKTAFATSPIPTAFAALLFAGDGDHALLAARELAYDGIDLSLRDPTDPRVVAFAEAAVGAGFTIGALGTGQSFHGDGLSLLSPDPNIVERLDDRMMRLIEFASKFKTRVIVGGIRGRLDNDPVKRREQYLSATESLRRYAGHAHRQGVGLLIEPLNRYETNFINTVGEAVTLIHDVGAENVQVLADTFHMNIEETTMTEPLFAAGTLLGHVQFADSNRRAPGQGHLDFRALADVLRTSGYAGSVSAEILPIPNSRTAAELAISLFRQL